MDNWKLVAGKFSSGILLASTILILLSGTAGKANADDHGSIRLYKLNKKGQVIGQRWSRKLDVDGCYNLSKPRKAHRFAQIGYRYCRVFTQKECPAGSELAAMWTGKKYRVEGLEIDTDQPQRRLFRGSKWVFDEKKNIFIMSIYCTY